MPTPRRRRRNHRQTSLPIPRTARVRTAPPSLLGVAGTTTGEREGTPYSGDFKEEPAKYLKPVSPPRETKNGMGAEHRSGGDRGGEHYRRGRRVVATLSSRRCRTAFFARGEHPGT